MSEQNTVVLVCAVVAAIGNLFSAWMALRAKQTSQETHQAVNSRMEGFLKTAEEKFRALGELIGQERERSRLQNEAAKAKEKTAG